MFDERETSMADEHALIPDGRVTLVLDEPPFAGGEVEVRTNVGWGVLKEIRRWLRDFRDADAGSDDEDEALQAAYRLFTEEALVSWNLADHKGPLTPDVEGMNRLTPLMATALIATWARAVTEDSRPLAESPTPS